MENIKNTDVTVEQSQEQDVTQAQEVQTESKESETKTFTQEDVNNLVARETKKAQEKVFKEFGFTDIKSAKDGFKQLNQFLESQKTEEQKRDEKINELTTANNEKDAQILQLTASNAALKLGVLPDSIDDVALLAQKEVNEDVTLEDAMKKVIDKYPHFAQKEEKNTKPTFTVKGNHTGTKEEDVWQKLRNQIESKKNKK